MGGALRSASDVPTYSKLTRPRTPRTWSLGAGLSAALVLAVGAWPAAQHGHDEWLRPPPPPPPAPSNVLIILADDVGVDALWRYGVNPGATPGLTPNIDLLMDAGLTFANAWANPTCSPTRASLLTGRHAFRTGIGHVIGGESYSLQPSELTIPEMLAAYAPGARYATAAFGKWHLEASPATQPCTPTDLHGFDLFEGTVDVLPLGSYCGWNEQLCIAGLGSVSTPIADYMPRRVVDVAAAWIGLQQGPWFCYLAPQTPFESHHVPPLELQSIVTGPECGACPVQSHVCYEAALQALDTKIGDLLASLGPGWPETTTIFFLGDNGSPVDETRPFWPPGQSKGTLYEGGIRVPFVVSGKAVDPRLWGTTTGALASVTDVFRTIAGIAGAGPLPPGVAEDSVDLRGVLQAPARVEDGPLGPFPGISHAPGRDTLFADAFPVNGPGPQRPGHVMALRDARHKLIFDCSAAAPIGLFDLVADPLERTNLLPPHGLPPPGTTLGNVSSELLARMVALTGCSLASTSRPR